MCKYVFTDKKLIIRSLITDFNVYYFYQQDYNLHILQYVPPIYNKLFSIGKENTPSFEVVETS